MRDLEDITKKLSERTIHFTALCHSSPINDICITENETSHEACALLSIITELKLKVTQSGLIEVFRKGTQ